MSSLTLKIERMLRDLHTEEDDDVEATFASCKKLETTRMMVMSDECQRDATCKALTPRFQKVWNDKKDACNFVERGEVSSAPSVAFLTSIGETLFRGTTSGAEFGPSGKLRGVGAEWATMGVKYMTKNIDKAKSYAVPEEGTSEYIPSEMGYILRMSTRKLLQHGVFRPGPGTDRDFSTYAANHADSMAGMSDMNEKLTVCSIHVNDELVWVPFMDATQHDFIQAIDEITITDYTNGIGVYHWYANDPTRIVMLKSDWAERVEACSSYSDADNLVDYVRDHMEGFIQAIPGPPPLPDRKGLMDTIVSMSDWDWYKMMQLKERMESINLQTDDMCRKLEEFVMRDDIDENDALIVEEILDIIRDVLHNEAEIDAVGYYVDDDVHMPENNVYSQLQTITAKALIALGLPGVQPILPPDTLVFHDYLYRANWLVSELTKMRNDRRRIKRRR